jgi:PAS domain S-box-containing protein
VKIKTKPICTPLLSFDIYLDHYHKLIKAARSHSDILQLQESINTTLTTQIESTIKNEPYDAIVVTDVRQKIVWVSEGFYDMTGYSSSYAIGKQPSFLQGKDTKETTKQAIRLHLNKDHSYTGSIINYRKDGEPYLCELKLFPLKNSKEKITHYVALERRLEAA